MDQPVVWVALEFYSDRMINYAEGGCVDEILLRKCTSGACSGSPAVPAPINGLLLEVASNITIP